MTETSPKPPDTAGALGWIARQLRWERTLADLRRDREGSGTHSELQRAA